MSEKREKWQHRPQPAAGQGNAAAAARQASRPSEQSGGGLSLIDGLAWQLKTKPLLGVFLAAIVAQMGLVILAQMLAQQELYFLSAISFGWDYRAFYLAAEAMLDGGNPYNPPLARAFTTPPPSAIVNIPLTALSFDTAAVVVSLLTYAAVAASMFLVHRVFAAPRESGRARDMAALSIFMVIPLYSYPFHFLFDRGNVDGFTLFLFCVGVCFLPRQTARRDIAAGFFFAAAISLKAYPALVVLPLLSGRRWRVLAALAGAMAFFFALSPAQWLAWIEWVVNARSEWFRTYQNGSLANTFYYIGAPFGLAEQFKNSAVYVWGAALLAMFAMDRQNMPRASAGNQTAVAGLALYIPFMLAVPQLAYHYELVCVLAMLPAVCFLWSGAATPGEKRILTALTVGIILTQFHAYAVEQLIVESRGEYRCSHDPLVCLPRWLPGFGLFIVMASCVAYKAWRLREAMPGRALGRG